MKRMFVLLFLHLPASLRVCVSGSGDVRSGRRNSDRRGGAFHMRIYTWDTQTVMAEVPILSCADAVKNLLEFNYLGADAQAEESAERTAGEIVSARLVYRSDLLAGDEYHVPCAMSLSFGQTFRPGKRPEQRPCLCPLATSP